MKFVNDKSKIDLDENKKDQLGIKETKQPERVKEDWHDAVTTTLVNLRKEPSISSKSLLQIRGGEVIKVDLSRRSGGFVFVKYGNNFGYMVKQYIKEI